MRASGLVLVRAHEFVYPAARPLQNVRPVVTPSEVHLDAELEARALSSDRCTRRLRRSHGECALVLKDLRLVRETPLVSDDEFTVLV